MAATRTALVLSRALGRCWRGLAVHVRVGLVATCAGLLLGVVLTLSLVTQREDLELRVAPLTTRGSTHLALDGEPVLLKAVLTPRPGHVLTYRWTFGDGSEAVTGTVSNPFGVSAVHTYPRGAAGRVYDAALSVTDATSGDVARTTYPVRFVEPTVENKRSIVLDDALWALHTSMVRDEDYVHGPVGHWDTGEYAVATTAMAVLAFEVNGFDARDEREGNPYQDTVERALAYLLQSLETTKLTPQPAGDPDSNGNGLGVTVRGARRPLYEVPLVAMALTASQARERVATMGAQGIVGRSFEALVVDMLDFLAFSQVDAEGPHRGGWRYTPNTHDADMSVTQWPVLAYLSARHVWGIEAPAWVKTELRDHYLKHAQAADGGFAYQVGSGRPNVGLTGAGLIALAFADVPAGDPRVKRAAAWIAAHWKHANVGDFYNMYAVMKGALLTQRPISAFGEHDWLVEYVEHLHTSQEPGGHWSGGGRWAAGTRRTAWPALIISKDVFATSRPASVAWAWILSASLLVLVVAVLVLRWLLVVRRRAAVAA